MCVFGRSFGGCQYVAWSPDSQYLAVSSDSHHCVAVWRVEVTAKAMAPKRVSADLSSALESHGGVSTLRSLDSPWEEADPLDTDTPLQSGWTVLAKAFWKRVTITRIALFYNHPLPCLAVCWHPRTPSILFYAFSVMYVAAVDVRNPYGTRQFVKLSDDGMPISSISPGNIFVGPELGTTDYDPTYWRDTPRPVINGMCVIGDRLAVAGAESIVTIPMLSAWSTRAHRLWPIRFKDAMKLLLLGERFGSRSKSDMGTEPATLRLCDLPTNLVILIMGKAAEPRFMWA